MTIRNLDKIFKPQRVAVIGASDNVSSVGYSVLRNLIGSGFSGVVYPVNAKREAVLGIPAYPSIAALPKSPDLAVVCTPSPTVPGLVRACGEAGVRGMVIISAGFRETGAQGKVLEQQVLEEAAKFDGLRIIGPNCLGIIVPSLKLNVSFAAAMPGSGRVAFISQSGALCTSVLDWALQEGIGFSYFVSIGNMIDVDFGDLIDYFGEDPETKSMLLYVESISESREFISSARAFAHSKPIIAYKSGRFAESAKAAASHTGALAGEDAVYDAAFQRAGIERIFDINDMFEVAGLLGRYQTPQGSRLAIMTNAGGPGVMATDALIGQRGQLADFSDETMKKLNECLPPFWSHGNPADILGDAPPERYGQAAQIILADPNVDAVLVILTPQAMTDPTATARVLGEAVKGSTKPVLASWMGGLMVSEGVKVLNQAGLATYDTPDQAVRAFMHLVSYAKNMETLYETPRDIPMSFNVDRAQLRGLFDAQALASSKNVLSEVASKTLLEAYGIPASRPYDAFSEDEAVRAAKKIGYPVVLKVLSPQITHKTDVGGVVLNVRGDEETRLQFRNIVASAKAKRPDADVQGVTVQKMVNAASGFELIIGAKKDPTFGSIIMVGMGGVAAEVFRDRALGLPPLSERLARRMLESLKSWPLLLGYRGRAGADIDRLLEVIMRFSYLIAEHPEITELDINPLLALPDDVVALDARVVVDPALVLNPPKPYSHLAVRPYPAEYTRTATLRDGSQVTLRAIRPEDEAAWRELISVCSPESIRFRFNYIFQGTTHEMASRYCIIDYDREMAILAEKAENGSRKILGVGRFRMDKTRESADYAILVGDPWQGQGIGKLLTNYCVEIAKGWGLKQLVAETCRPNARMLGILHKQGFVEKETGEDTVSLVKPLP
jgi:acetyltransferase